jgi:hypothetical protein
MIDLPVYTNVPNLMWGQYPLKDYEGNIVAYGHYKLYSISVIYDWEGL